MLQRDAEALHSGCSPVSCNTSAAATFPCDGFHCSPASWCYKCSSLRASIVGTSIRHTGRNQFANAFRPMPAYTTHWVWHPSSSAGGRILNGAPGVSEPHEANCPWFVTTRICGLPRIECDKTKLASAVLRTQCSHGDHTSLCGDHCGDRILERRSAQAERTVGPGLTVS